MNFVQIRNTKNIARLLQATIAFNHRHRLQKHFGQDPPFSCLAVLHWLLRLETVHPSEVFGMCEESVSGTRCYWLGFEHSGVV